MEYRHELKFLVPNISLIKLKYRLEPLMRHDDNQANEFYRIRSLYFDDYFDSCINENLAGTDARKKYRIRYYENNLNYINLECKSKLRGMTRKVAQSLSVDEVQTYIDGCNDGFENLNDASLLTTKLFLAQQQKGMKPRCIVEYDRCAFVEDVGNVRITFDTNIRGSNEIDKFFEPSSEFMIPALDAGYQVLEVKYDEFLPQYLLEVIDINNLHRQSISKYGLVREALAKGGI